MMERFLFWNWWTLALLFVSAAMSAQEIVEVVDSVDIDEFDQVDICENPKYAIVTRDGMQGIYDLVVDEYVTEIEYRELGFSRQTEAEDGTPICVFYAKKGKKQGVINVSESNNHIMSIWMDDPDEVYSLEECTTIDEKITKRAKELLETFIFQQKMDNAQVVILDATSGRLKTWIALDTDMEKEEAGKLLAHSCTGSLIKPFHSVMALRNRGLSLDSIYNGINYRHGIKTVDNEMMFHAIQNGYVKDVGERKWKEMIDTRKPSTCPFIIAVGYNSLANEGRIIIPTMKADSVEVEEGVFSALNLACIREVLTVEQTESPQLAWLPADINWLGYATTEDIYSDEDIAIGKQIQFAGVFPVENPQFTICIVADKHSLDVTPSVFQEVVNPLSKWLLKR